jgi:hypothetical protein
MRKKILRICVYRLQDGPYLLQHQMQDFSDLCLVRTLQQEYRTIPETTVFQLILSIHIKILKRLNYQLLISYLLINFSDTNSHHIQPIH